MPTLSPIMIVMGRQDLTTCPLVPPLSQARSEPRLPAKSPGGF
jgi:hypothetical protein